MGDTFSTELIVGLLTRAHIVWAACTFLAKSLKTKSDPASAGISEGRQIWEVYFKRRCSLGFLRGPTYRTVYSFLGKSLKIKSVVQRRLEFLKAVRFGRYVLNDFVCLASCGSLHGLGCIFISSAIPENQNGVPASAGISEGHQIWKRRFR